RLSFQPIAVEEVADRLVALAAAAPQGMAEDMAGPEQITLDRIMRIWDDAHGRSRRFIPIPAPSAPLRNFARGTQLGTLPGAGRQTFAEYAAVKAAESAQAETS